MVLYHRMVIKNHNEENESRHYDIIEAHNTTDEQRLRPSEQPRRQRH